MCLLFPYILAYKSQNLPRNLARKFRGRHDVDEFGDDDDDAVYNDDDEDYANLLHPVQVSPKHLRLIHGSMILDHMRTRF